MKISEILNRMKTTVYSPGDGEKIIDGVILGDLFSFVMAEAREGWLWITIQIHLNVSAVAVLKDVPFILLASDRKPEKELIERCASEGITLAGTTLTSYEAAGKLYEMGVGGRS